MTTTATTAAGGGSQLADWISIAVLAAYIAVLVWVALGRPPLKAAALRTVMRSSQGGARVLGHIGLHAEAAYRQTVSPSGGAP